jgi:hypothetical protein
MTANLTETVLTVDGLRSPMLQAGPPHATEAVVFGHGNSGSSQDWARLVERDGALARAVAWDHQLGTVLGAPPAAATGRASDPTQARTKWHDTVPPEPGPSAPTRDRIDLLGISHGDPSFQPPGHRGASLAGSRDAVQPWRRRITVPEAPTAGVGHLYAACTRPGPRWLQPPARTGSQQRHRRTHDSPHRPRRAQHPASGWSMTPCPTPSPAPGRLASHGRPVTVPAS